MEMSNKSSFSPEQPDGNTAVPAAGQPDPAGERSGRTSPERPAGTNRDIPPREPEIAEPAAPAGADADYFGVSPDYLFELPGAESFRTAIEKMRLPEVVQGKPFECVIRLFTLNNGFGEKIRIDSVECVGRNDFSAEISPRKSLLHLKGTPAADGEITICFRYTALSTFSNLLAYPVRHDCVKKIRVSPDPVSKWNSSFKYALKTGNLSPRPRDGRAGASYEEKVNFKPGDASVAARVFFTSVRILPDCGVTAEITPAGEVRFFGCPTREADLELTVWYEYSLGGGVIRDNASMYPFAHIARDVAYEHEERFLREYDKLFPRRPNPMAGREAKFEVPLRPLIDPRFLEITGFRVEDENFSGEYDPEAMVIKGRGVPQSPGSLQCSLKYRVKTACGNVERIISKNLFNVTPDPRTLWKNKPTDPNAPYQIKDAEFQLVKAGERVIVAASKRGRSHANDGTFRDDSFKVEHIPETGWIIVAVSDGAGSAKFSRAGSKITCETFCRIMKEKLSSEAANAKIDGMTEEERDEALRRTVLKAAYQCLSDIDAEARARNTARKDYSATFLGYVMKKFGGQWLIVSMGIGDGIIGLLDRDDQLRLLTEPDGGEYVGQTRFITMNEVWSPSPIERVRTARVSDFRFIMSMTDGVSDPKFETDNNLSDRKLWLDLWEEIDSQVPLADRSEETARKLCDWLDFYVNANHDDRTLVIVY